MARTINFFPTLDIDQVNDTEIVVKYDFYYKSKDNNVSIPIKHKEVNNSINLETKESKWDPYNYDLYLIISITGKKFIELYGPTGIAPKLSYLSICVEWLSQKWKKRAVILSSKVISPTIDEQIFTFQLKFSKNTFIHDIDIKTLVYLKRKAPRILENEDYLNNSEGVVLGVLDSKTLYMTGVGSLFPIYTKPLKNGKLWELQIDFNEPEIEKLSESMRLILNSNHKDYKYLDSSNKDYCERMIYEIVSTAMTLLICQLKDEGHLENLEKEFADGSILNFVKYYKEILGLNVNSISSISSSIREYLENKE